MCEKSRKKHAAGCHLKIDANASFAMVFKALFDGGAQDFDPKAALEDLHLEVIEAKVLQAVQAGPERARWRTRRRRAWWWRA